MTEHSHSHSRRDPALVAVIVTALVGSVLAQSPPSCSITSPMAGAVVWEDVVFDYTVSDADLDPVLVVWEFSTDVGTTYQPMTASSGSPTGNPALGLATPGSYTFIWDSCIDVPLAMMLPVHVRMAVDDGLFVATCFLEIILDNGPSCTILSPLGGVHGGVIPVDFTSTERCSPIFQGEAWVQTSPGGPFTLATPAGGGGNPFSLSAGPATFLWDSAADVPGFAAGVQISISVQSLWGTSGCQTTFDVDNSVCFTFCGDCDLNGIGPDVLDAFTAGAIAVQLIPPSVQQTICCDVDASGSINVLDSLLIAQTSVGIAVPLTCP